MPTRYEDRIRETIDGIELLCTRCGEQWPADTEFFQLMKSGKFHSYCKGCNTEFQRNRRAKLPRRARRNLRFITYRGETMPLQQWANRVGISWKSLRERLDTLQWPLEKALTQPVRRYCGRV